MYLNIAICKFEYGKMAGALRMRKYNYQADFVTFTQWGVHTRPLSKSSPKSNAFFKENEHIQKLVSLSDNK